jgi:hypothetical protein
MSLHALSGIGLELCRRLDCVERSHAASTCRCPVLMRMTRIGYHFDFFHGAPPLVGGNCVADGRVAGSEALPPDRAFCSS